VYVNVHDGLPGCSPIVDANIETCRTQFAFEVLVDLCQQFQQTDAFGTRQLKKRVAVPTRNDKRVAGRYRIGIAYRDANVIASNDSFVW
jgi:hypothetical protein